MQTYRSVTITDISMKTVFERLIGNSVIEVTLMVDTTTIQSCDTFLHLGHSLKKQDTSPCCLISS